MGKVEGCRGVWSFQGRFRGSGSWGEVRGCCAEGFEA